MTEFDGFFDHDPACAAAFAALRDALMKRYPAATVTEQKTCLSFRDPRPFCYVSLARAWKRKQNPERHIIVTFGLDMALPDGRIWQTVPVSSNRVTHHVIVRGAEEIDEQLLAWIHWAHELKVKG